MSQIKERPILFQSEMVQAILERRKTQTRRVVKGIALEWLAPEMFTPEFVANPENKMCPYGQIGDRLWVRETWKPKYVKGGLSGFQIQYPNVHPWFYAADGETEKGYGGWKPSIHMLRAACRILLEITNIRVERLQDISEEDAKAEGVSLPDTLFASSNLDYRICFKTLWQSINGPESWEANPWVWAIEFKRVEATT